MWMGTRSGYLFLLDASAIEKQEQEMAIKGFQYCGDGRVKGITPFPSSLKVSETQSLSKNFWYEISLQYQY